MDGLFKLLFYVIIGIVWILSNRKKQTLWKDEENPDFSAQKPKVNPLPKPRMDQPSHEGIFSEAEKTASFDPFKESYYDKKLEMKKKRLQEKKDHAVPASLAVPISNINLPVEKIAKPSIPAISASSRQKQSYHLKSSLKEGIIWSIVLGAPRSKHVFNWQADPLNR